METFTNAHLKKLSTNHHRLMICSHGHRGRNRTLRSSSLKFLVNDRLNSQDYSPIPSFQHPPIGDSDVTSTTQIVGSCNGLILLAFRSPSFLILWNPSTRQVNNTIPPPPKGYQCFVYGFGYDDSTDDYKIVRILTSNSKPSETHIYSLKTVSWKKIANFDDNGRYLINRDPGKYLNGKLHWKAGCGHKTIVIVSLDLAQGKYDILARPKQLLHRLIDRYHLDVLGGCLCLVSHDDVWFMKKYGDPKSWTSTKAFSYLGIPIWLAENGDVSVALRGSTVIIYDYDRRTKSHASRVYTVVGYTAGHSIYFETLVSPFDRQDLGQ